MSLALPRRSDAYDDRILTLGVVVDDATLLLLGTHADVEDTLAHELSHIVVGLAAEGPYSTVPRWLDEGLAMYAEGGLPDDNSRALERAIQQDSLISVRSLSGYSGIASEVDLFYGEVYSLVGFMLEEYGRDRMALFVDLIHDGHYQEDALRQVYGFGLDGLDEHWRQSVGLGPRQDRSSPKTAEPSSDRQTPDWQSCWGSLAAGILSVFAAAVGRVRAGTA
jgi:hypothetical protein